ncbi:MAG: hypothetical protein ACHQ1F_06900 [Spirochaetia bacterium]
MAHGVEAAEECLRNGATRGLRAQLTREHAHIGGGLCAEKGQEAVNVCGVRGSALTVHLHGLEDSEYLSKACPGRKLTELGKGEHQDQNADLMSS